MDDTKSVFNLWTVVTMILSALRSSKFLKVLNPIRHLIPTVANVFSGLKWYLILLFFCIIVLGPVQV